MLRHLLALSAALFCCSALQAQVWTGSALTSPQIAPVRLVIVYRDGQAPGANAVSAIAVAGGTLVQRLGASAWMPSR